jgi:RecB family exonuclease
MKDNTKLVLSASRVKTFQTCARKYYYTYIKKLPRLAWDHFDIGTIVHSVLEEFHNTFRDDKNVLDLNGLMTKCFANQKEKILKEKKIKNSTFIEARDLLKEYLRNLKDKGLGSLILCNEEDFIVQLNDDFKVQGFIDRIDEDKDNIYHIKDYKTTKSNKYMEPFQLITYGIHLSQKFPTIEHFRGSYVMLKFGGMLVSYDFNQEDVEKAKKSLIEYGNLICEEQKWAQRPSKLCSFCDFQKVCLTAW